MSKTFLSFGLDPALLEVTSSAFARQRGFFFGMEATLIVFRVGESSTVHQEGLTVIGTGGSSKAAALLRGARLAFAQPHVDVVISQDAGPLGMLAWLVAKKFRARLFLQDHAGLFARPAFGLREALLRPVSLWLFRRADRIRAVSERARKGLVRAGVERERISVFPIRSDISLFARVERRPASSPLIVCVARLEKEKGIGVLLEALSRLTRRAECVIVGTGSERGALEARAKALGVTSRVTFVGKKSAAQIAEIFSRATAYVQPSFFEGWGMAVVEAAAAGLPVVMTDVGCAGELLRDGESAVIVHVGNVDGLAAGLDRVLADEGLASRLGEGARNTVLRLPGPAEGIEEMRRWLMS